jgi:glycosyltransferase involved in cell wall biosynthesis
VHTFLSTLHALFIDKYDVILMMNAANALFTWIPKIRGTKVALNVDGIERLRKKWGILGRLYYRMGERLATVLPDVIICDAKVIQDYYLSMYKAPSVLIAYGAEVGRTESIDMLKELGVHSKGYVLYVTRFEPENNPHILIDAFSKVTTEKRLIVVGDAPYSNAYKKILHETASRDPRVMLPGFIYGKGYRELLSHAYCYVQATEVGGTHPALIEAMGAGNCVIANETPENIEVLSDVGLVYKKNDADDLTSKIQMVLDNEHIVEDFRIKAAERIKEIYNCERITAQYHELFIKMNAQGK